MFRSFLTLALLLFAGLLPLAAQSDGPASPAATAKELGSAPTSTPSNPKRVWTNEDLGGPVGNASVANNKTSQKNPPAPNKTADPATIDRIKKNLKKLQEQLADLNLKLDNFRKFQQGENVSSAGRDVSKSYTRTPIEQQVATLQDKKKQLELQIDALYEEARKKEIEPGQLR
jgi:hypothetical protein